MANEFGALDGAQNTGTQAQLDPFIEQTDEERGLAWRIEKDVAKAMSKVLAFRQEAKSAQGAYDGHQWDELDRMRLEQLRRPTLTFNEIKPTINAISGIERLNRYDMRFVARPLDSQPQLDMKGDLASEAYATVLDMCNGDMERSAAIRDMSIVGMGWTEIFMDYTLDADGRVQIKRRPWKEMLWDTAAREDNIEDSRWRARKRDMERTEFKKRWPKWLELVDIGTPQYEEQNVTKYELVTPYYSLANEKANPQVGEQGAPKSTIPVVQYQWRETEPVYRFADPSAQGGITEMREKEYKALKKRLVQLGARVPDAVRQLRTVYYQAFVSRGVLLEGPTELVGGFSLKCYTGEYDDSQGIWYGIVRPLLDPQKTMNKSLSTALTMFLTNAKGGVMYETGTFVDPWLAKDQWSKTDAWIEVNEGKLQGVMQRQPMKFDGTIDLFFNEAKSAMSYVSGLPSDLLAQAAQDANAPTISRRIQAGMGVLGWYFDNINRGRKDEARTTLEYIRHYWSQGQFIRVGGNANSPAIPLLKSNLPDQYDLMLDESVRHNPNLKAQVWQDLQPIIPALLKFGLGRFLLQALKFSPLPAQLVQEMQKEAMQMQQQAAQGGGQQQGKGRGKQDPPELIKAKVGKMSAETQRIIAQAKKLDTETRLRPIEMVMDNVHKVGKQKVDAQRARDQAEQADLGHKHKVLDTVLRSMQAFLGHGLEVDKAAHEAVQLARYDKGDE